MKNGIILSVVFMLVLSASAFALDEKNVTVDVSVQMTSQITVLPTSLAWINVSIGTAPGYKNLSIRNTGSANISNVFAYVDTLATEAVRPYDSPSGTAYSAGSLITLRNESGWQVPYAFVGRIEWNWTEDIPNKDLSNLSSPVSWGYFRNASNEYIWAVSNYSEGRCNETGAQFSIEDDVDDGTIGTRTPSTDSISYDGSFGGWGIFSVNRATSPLNDYCVAVNETCGKIYIYKYDKRTIFGNCANSRYIQTDNLYPNEIVRIRVDLHVPRGLPVGSLATTKLTISGT
jgi:hypothetical protein